MVKKEEKVKLVLLDVHAILHRAYHALPDFVSSKGEPTGGIYGLCAMLLKIIGELKPDYIFACYDLPQPTYRHEAYEGYKAGRAKADDSLVMQIKRSRDVFKAFNIPIYDSPGFEADDILGTIVQKIQEGLALSVKCLGKDQSNPEISHPKPYTLIANRYEVIIASGDMDTMQLIRGKDVQVYTLKKGINDTILYDEKKVRERFGFGPELLPDYKGLNGDPSDNIIGVSGIGEKTATNLIVNFGTIENIYKKLKKGKEEFLKKGIKERIINLLTEHEEEARFSKELATIRKDAPINFDLPEKKWSETIEFSNILRLFIDLEFRTLGARTKQVFEKNGTKVREGEMGADVSPTTSDSSEISLGEILELKIAVWLLNSTITNPETADILNYAKTNSLAEARNKILEDIKKQNLEFVFEKIEKPLALISWEMGKIGIKVDTDYLKNLSLDYHKKLSALEKSIWREAGQEFNVSSPKQLGEIIFRKLGLKAKNQKKTGTGALSTKESELEKLRDVHPIINMILEYREFDKLLSTYIDNIPSLVAPDGRLHTNFVQTGTTTGRMASRDPNLQNIPHKSDRGKEIRKAFVAENGNKIVTFDYSQIELRIAAFLSGDKKLIEVFREGGDIHTAVASEVFGVSLDKVDYEMRRRAKVINFGIIYGMGINALCANLKTNREEAQKFYGAYFQRFSGLAKYLEDVKASATKSGYTETYFGRRRYFEGLRSKLPYVRASAERMAINAPIQGTEADIIKLAMIGIDEYLKKENLENDVRMLLQVHDELVFEIKESLVVKVSPKIKEIMESIIPPKDIKGIVCRVDVSVGENWEELKKVSL